MPDSEEGARLKVRDDLLEAILAKLERKRDTRPMAAQIRRGVARIASLESTERGAPDFEERLTDVVGDWIARFGALTGSEKPPARLRPLKIKLVALVSHFRELQEEAPLASRKRPRLQRQQVEWWQSAGRSSSRPARRPLASDRPALDARSQGR